jgi:hypothetical protein
MNEDLHLLREQARKIEKSGALGRSRSYARLLEFLIDSSDTGRIPKELEIAMGVFSKGADFDPSQDSMVRVYAHNLRQKLEHYYATEGRAEPRRLVLARGEYRVSLSASSTVKSDEAAAAVVAAPAPTAAQPTPTAAQPMPTALAEARLETRASPAPVAQRVVADVGSSRTLGRRVAAAFALLAIGVLAGVFAAGVRQPAPSSAQLVAASPIWAGVLADDMPILVVIGDYYIFGEVDKHAGDVKRLIRDFTVNSSKDLDELLMSHPDMLGRYMDLDLTYLPRGSALGLLNVLRVLYTTNKPVRVVSMSELSIADLKSNHVVYIGYLSALGKLEDFVFASSSLTIGSTYDELRNIENGETYTSEAGMPESHGSYRDYGFISTFPGPNGNQFVIIAGTRDPGMVEAAHVLSDPTLIKSLESARPDKNSAGPPAFEMLYEVAGSARTNLDAMLVHSAKLDSNQIWGGNFLHAEVEP